LQHDFALSEMGRGVISDRVAHPDLSECVVSIESDAPGQYRALVRRIGDGMVGEAASGSC
jgi:hypothetical protein